MNLFEKMFKKDHVKKAQKSKVTNEEFINNFKQCQDTAELFIQLKKSILDKMDLMEQRREALVLHTEKEQKDSINKSISEVKDSMENITNEFLEISRLASEILQITENLMNDYTVPINKLCKDLVNESINFFNDQIRMTK